MTGCGYPFIENPKAIANCELIRLRTYNRVQSPKLSDHCNDTRYDTVRWLWFAFGRWIVTVKHKSGWEAFFLDSYFALRFPAWWGFPIAMPQQKKNMWWFDVRYAMSLVGLYHVMPFRTMRCCVLPCHIVPHKAFLKDARGCQGLHILPGSVPINYDPSWHQQPVKLGHRMGKLPNHGFSELVLTIVINHHYYSPLLNHHYSIRGVILLINSLSFNHQLSPIIADLKDFVFAGFFQSSRFSPSFEFRSHLMTSNMIQHVESIFMRLTLLASG